VGEGGGFLEGGRGGGRREEWTSLSLSCLSRVIPCKYTCAKGSEVSGCMYECVSWDIWDMRAILVERRPESHDSEDRL
jgi:hypothetical protein